MIRQVIMYDEAGTLPKEIKCEDCGGSGIIQKIGDCHSETCKKCLNEGRLNQ